MPRVFPLFQQPAGGWFSQVGTLHEVHHLWQVSVERTLFSPVYIQLKDSLAVSQPRREETDPRASMERIRLEQYRARDRQAGAIDEVLYSGESITEIGGYHRRLD
jgi:hypothetical protein